jgi:threonine dehydrogenase-like Zn-dependent dehydrogenase
LVGLVASGRAAPEFIVDKVVGIEQVPVAYKLFDQKEALKVAIRF